MSRQTRQQKQKHLYNNNNINNNNDCCCLLLSIVPSDILSNIILSQYCNGKTISTFAIALEGYYYNKDENGRRKVNRNNQIINSTKILKTNRMGNKDDGRVNEIYNTVAAVTTATTIIRNALTNRFFHLLNQVRKRIMKKKSKMQQQRDLNTYNNETDDNEEYVDPTILLLSEQRTSCEIEDVLLYYLFSVIRNDNQWMFSSSSLEHGGYNNNNNNNSSSTQFYSSNDDYNNNNNNKIDNIRIRMQSISILCSIIDYFELPYHSINNKKYDTNDVGLNNNNDNGYIIWIGPLETSQGNIQQSAMLTTVGGIYNWTVTSLLYWYNDFELYQYKISIPYTSPNIRMKKLYGTITVWDKSSYNDYNNNNVTTAISDDDDDDDDQYDDHSGYNKSTCLNRSQDALVLEHLCYSLNDEYDPLGRYSLTPQHSQYNNSNNDDDTGNNIVFTKKSKMALNCYWGAYDNDDDNNNTDPNNDNDIDHRNYSNDDIYDWEDGIEQFSTNIIRIMNRLSFLQE